MEDIMIFNGKMQQMMNYRLVMENPFYFPLPKIQNTFVFIKIMKFVVIIIMVLYLVIMIYLYQMIH